MDRISSRAPLLCLSLLLPLAVACGNLDANGTGECAADLTCTDDAPAIFVEYNGMPDENCAPDPGGASYKTSGTLDLLIGTSYILYPVLKNNLAPSESVSFARPAGGGGLNGAKSEMNTVTLTRAEVTLDLPSTLSGVAKSRTIPLSGSALPGEEFALDLTVIPSNVGSNLQLNPAFASGDAIEIGVQVRFYGETVSHNEVVSNVFNFPISLCRGCGIVYPPEANTAPSGVPNCSNLGGVSDSSAFAGNRCNLGQDLDTDCRLVCSDPSIFSGRPEDFDKACNGAN